MSNVCFEIPPILKCLVDQGVSSQSLFPRLLSTRSWTITHKANNAVRPFCSLYSTIDSRHRLGYQASRKYVCLSHDRSFHTAFSLQRDLRQPSRQKSLATNRTRSLRESLPLPPLPSHEIAKIFSPNKVSVQSGNFILRTLQRRRQTGSLVEYGLQLGKDHANVPPDALERALEWLRARYPLDEAVAAEVWADLQAKKLEDSYIARGQQLGLYKKDVQPVKQKWSRTERDVAKRIGEDNAVRTGVIYGSDPRASVLDNLKKLGERKRKAEKKMEKEAQLLEEKLGGLQEIGTGGTEMVVMSAKQKAQLKQAQLEQNQAAKLKRNADWVEHHRKLASGSESTEVPNMTRWERLAPSTILAISLVIMVTFATGFYNPPAKQDRMFPEIPPFYLTIGSITAINTAIWILWKYPPAWRVLNKYFVCVPSKPVALSLFGNLFSHQEIGHLFGNTCALWAFGYELHDYVGRANFVAIYISGGLIGALMSLWVSVFRGMWNYWHFGASGCTYAVMVAWVMIQATLPLKRDDLWSYSADVGRYAYAMMTVIQHLTPRFIREWDIVAHAGGAITGYIWAQILKFRAKLTLREGQGAPFSVDKPN